jgi:hypothetical protein
MLSLKASGFCWHISCLCYQAGFGTLGSEALTLRSMTIGCARPGYFYIYPPREELSQENRSPLVELCKYQRITNMKYIESLLMQSSSYVPIFIDRKTYLSSAISYFFDEGNQIM